MEIEFTVGGSRKRLTTKQITKRLRKTKPGVVRTHGVRVHGVVYPVKEAFALVTGVDPLDFNTNQARSLFKRLGLDVVRVQKRTRRP